jgi:hypothetical protein
MKKYRIFEDMPKITTIKDEVLPGFTCDNRIMADLSDSNLIGSEIVILAKVVRINYLSFKHNCFRRFSLFVLNSNISNVPVGCIVPLLNSSLNMKLGDVWSLTGMISLNKEIYQYDFKILCATLCEPKEVRLMHPAHVEIIE